MRIFFLAMAIGAIAIIYYNDEIRYQLMLWSGGSNGYQYHGSSVTHGMAGFGSSLGNGFRKMGEGISGN
jgi:hypothetical protein